MQKGIAIIFVLFFSFLAHGQKETTPKIGGMTLMAPPRPFVKDPMPELTEINVGWVAVVPYSFTPGNQSRVIFGNDHSWWGESPKGTEETIKLAKQNGLNVMLKPQVWVHGSWIGDLKYSSNREWEEWESGYREYILTHARIAEKHKVKLLCIGTEIRHSVQNRNAFWRKLIKEIRSVYSGKLTYCANWDDYEKIDIWDALDYIGISAYFPLLQKSKPSTEDLMRAWKPIQKKLKTVSEKFGKQILFAEYGYLSVDGCTWNTWELEKIKHTIPNNELAQSNAIECLLGAFCDAKYWAGGFLWKWFPHGYGHKSSKNNDYTPQGKVAEETLKKWYGEFLQTDN